MSNTEGKNVRYTIDMDTSYREDLAKLAKGYKLTQGEVIEVLLDSVRDMQPGDLVDNLLRGKRDAKVATRKSARETLSKIKSLPPEKLAAILEQVG